MKKNTTKRSLLASVLALAMCVTMLVGTTFAWFTDSASTSVNRIQAGTLNVDIVDESGDSLDGKSLSFRNVAGETNIFWEPGATFFTQGFKIVNEGDLALKYKVVVSGLTGDAKLLEAIDFAFVTDSTKKDADAVSFAEEGQLLTKGASAPADNAVYYYLRGHMKEDANNDYQGLTLEGVSITVYATQYTYENDSFNNEYDANAGKDTAFYSLADFNKLTEIPAGVKNVYVNMDNVSLAGSDVTIGNESLRDVWTWDKDTSHAVGEVLEDGRKVYMVRDNDTIYNSNKAGFTLYITGSVNNTTVGGNVNASAKALRLSIPDNCDVVFTKNFSVNGYFRMIGGVLEGKNLGGAVYRHTVNSVLFDHSTFNGIWIQNSVAHIPECDGLAIKNLTFDGCAFNAYTNVTSPNDSNPLWLCGTRDCNITIKNCSFKASRPIKLAEQRSSGVNLTIMNNTFDMSAANSANKENEPKNVAIMFCNIQTGTLGNVVISGNKVENGTALMAFQSENGFTMAEGAAFKVSDNILNGAKLGVKWKTTTEFTPDFVK